MLARLLGGLLVLVGLVFVAPGSLVLAEDSACESGKVCSVEEALSMGAKLASSETEISDPAWLAGIVEFTYEVDTRGEITADLKEFKEQAFETLNSSEGWVQLGVRFTEVESGGDFTIVLTASSSVPSFSSGCSAEYSCRVGRYVVINQDRWVGATEAWNNAGGSLRDYRHMVMNHEVGHWLGHDHLTCDGPGNLAFVMQQQSADLGGCKFNPWPRADEIWTDRL